jgi:hypothetical protein
VSFGNGGSCTITLHNSYDWMCVMALNYRQPCPVPPPQETCEKAQVVLQHHEDIIDSLNYNFSAGSGLSVSGTLTLDTLYLGERVKWCQSSV